MTVGYSVTFEFPTRSPLTHRGTVSAGQAQTLASKAVKAARTALRPVAWSSFIVCLDKGAFQAPTAEPEAE